MEASGEETLPLAEALAQALARRGRLAPSRQGWLSVALAPGEYELAAHPWAPPDVRMVALRLTERFGFRRRRLAAPGPRQILLLLPVRAPFGTRFWETLADLLAESAPAPAEPSLPSAPAAPTPPTAPVHGASSGWVMGGIRRPGSAGLGTVAAPPPPPARGRG
ncbi:MAG: hypothetical protein K6U14_02305 [Firmicutes bacterium]|nr:hypothetical protein [Alicyclobacillaceae bacterium]MCL6496453.1 hypothetical protein [Bacillota bacterium]